MGIKRPYNYLGISDLHIGCPRIDYKEFYAKIKRFLYPRLMKTFSDPDHIDVLFVAGDTFDTLLSLNSPVSIMAMNFIDDLIRMSVEYQFVIRVIRGTYTHDRNQPAHFIKDLGQNNMTCKMFDKMTIEKLPNIPEARWVLYLPDNLPFDNVYEQIEDMLKQNQLKHVDIIVNHGYFTHLLPDVLKNMLPHGTLDIDRVNKFLTPGRGFVINGHVHQGKVTGNVYSCSSFEITCHGEVESFYHGALQPIWHGFWIFHDFGDHITSEYVHNENKAIFRTIKLNEFDNNPDQAIELFKHDYDQLLEETVSQRDLCKMIHLRIISGNTTTLEACSQYAKLTDPNVFIDKISTVKHEQVIDNINTKFGELPIITPTNLAELMLPIIQTKNSKISNEEIQTILDQCN